MIHSKDSSWINPSNQNCKIIFYQGLNQSQVQCAKYTQPHGFVATTGEIVKCNKSLNTIQQPFIGEEIGEVNLTNFTTWSSCFNPISLTYKILSSSSRQYYGIEIEPVYQQPSSTPTVKYHTVDVGKICVGQSNDINSHKKKFNLWQQQAGKSINEYAILYGVSRGAATTFNAVALNKYDLSKVKMLILEGCPNNIKELLYARHSWPIASLVYNFLKNFTAFNPAAPCPTDLINDFPAKIPVIFISSLKDEKVPYEQTKEIADKLAERNKNPVYLLTLKKSSHSSYMFDDKEDIDSYKTFIHAIYKKYDAPHNQKLAEQGEPLIKQCRLNPA